MKKISVKLMMLTFCLVGFVFTLGCLRLLKDNPEIPEFMFVCLGAAYTLLMVHETSRLFEQK